MKKFFLVPLLAAAVLYGCVSQKPSSTAGMEGLGDSTAEQPSSEQAAAAEEKAPEKKLVEKTIIEAAPLLVRETSFFAPGIMDGYTIFTYERAPGLLPIKAAVFDMDNKPIESMEYENKNGRNVKTTIFGADGAVRSYRVYEYDDAGRLVFDSMFDARNRLQSKSAYEYDGEGMRVRWNVYTGGDVLQAYTVYAYSDGLVRAVDFFSAAGIKESYITYEYDGEGRIIKESFYTADNGSGALDKYTEYVYTNGLKTEEKYFRGNKSLNRKISYTYDEKGSVKEAEYVNASGKTQEIKRYEYEYRDVEKKVQVYE